MQMHMRKVRVGWTYVLLLTAKGIRLSKIIVRNGYDVPEGGWESFLAVTINDHAIDIVDNEDIMSSVAEVMAVCDELVLINYMASQAIIDTTFMLLFSCNGFIPRPMLRGMRSGLTFLDLGVTIPFLRFRHEETAAEQRRRFLVAANDCCMTVSQDVLQKVTELCARWVTKLAYPEDWIGIRKLLKLFSSFGPNDNPQRWDTTDLRQISVIVLGLLENSWRELQTSKIPATIDFSIMMRFFSFNTKRWILLLNVLVLFLLGLTAYMQVRQTYHATGNEALYEEQNRPEGVHTKDNAAYYRKEMDGKNDGNAKKSDNTMAAKSSLEDTCAASEGNPVKATYESSEMASSLKFGDLTWHGDKGIWDEEIQKRFYENYLNTEAEQNRSLKVFLVPFSHADPGWLQTVDGYMEGSTKHTLNLMVEHLTLWKDRTFIWAEISFFEMWWNTINETIKEQVRTLVEEGRLEFVNGGYVMPDEANCHYYAIIHQYVYGHQWLHQTFNITVKHGFSIDPFGYSSTMPYILKNMGFDSMYIQRIHYVIRKRLVHSGVSQFLWQQPWDKSSTDSMFCYINHGTVYTLKYTCGVEPHVCKEFDYETPRQLDERLVPTVSRQLMDQFRKLAYLHPHNILLIPMGDDFRWGNKLEWDAKYGNFKKIADYLNSDPKYRVHIQFGTFKNYYDAVFKAMGKPGKEWKTPVLKGDFFPYADRYMEYWTGYFTSHPYQKSLSRMLEQQLRTAEILYSIALLRNERLDDAKLTEGLQKAARNLGLYQHHDAITGTSKQAVSDDYELRLLDGLNMTDKAITHIAAALFYPESTAPKLFESHSTIKKSGDLPSQRIIKLNEEGAAKYVVIFSSLASARHVTADLYVDTEDVVIEDEQGHAIQYQVSPMLDPQSNSGKILDNGFRLTFVTEFKTIGFQTFTIRAANESTPPSQHATRITEKVTDFSKDIILSNTLVSAEFSPVSGLLKAITDLSTGIRRHIRIEFKRYETTQSGAYIFWPNAIADLLPDSHTVRILEGDIYSEIHVMLPGILYQTVRLFHVNGDLGKYLDVNIVDNLASQRNLEAVLRLTTDLRNDLTFFADSNGFQMVKRRASHDLPTQANYYPATSMAFMHDKKSRLTIHLARAHGVGSQDVGQMEVMFDRILTQDDGRGLQEALNDYHSVHTHLRIQLETNGYCRACATSADPTALANRVNLDLNYPPTVLTANVQGNETSLGSRLTKLTGSLPCSTHLVLLKPLYVQRRSFGAIFHKLGADCESGDGGDPQECVKDDVIYLSKFLRSNIQNATRSTLNFVNHIGNTGTTAVVELERKKLTAVKFLLAPGKFSFFADYEYVNKNLYKG
ncbi:alpha-mannosidase 2x-like [Paramacrobiotus metropolitanus]|uniref:alpha-mannosidase 2x-like n=1 Tax=Paramacrobiotus metropolitanus TaxID=2943436 RepID=UPI00244586E3|nr:alpha-mannosidase 2x-like [Paramacrobiotus metropolitanus]